jgi:hypothetical protein
MHPSYTPLHCCVLAGPPLKYHLSSCLDPGHLASASLRPWASCAPMQECQTHLRGGKNIRVLNEETRMPALQAATRPRRRC